MNNVIAFVGHMRMKELIKMKNLNFRVYFNDLCVFWFHSDLCFLDLSYDIDQKITL